MYTSFNSISCCNLCWYNNDFIEISQEEESIELSRMILDSAMKNEKESKNIDLFTFSLRNSLNLEASDEQSDQSNYCLNMLILDVQTLILEKCDLPGLKTMREVSKYWEQNVAQNSIWEGIGRSLQMNLIAKSSVDVKDFIILIKNNLRNCFLSETNLYCKSIKNEINALLLNEEIAKVNILQKVCEAKDTLTVWNVLAITIGQPKVDFSALNSLRDLLLKKDEFATWFVTHQASLLQLQELELQQRQLMSLPPEIGLFTQLQKLWLHENQLLFLPPEIWQLTQLQMLGLENNQLTSLPPGIEGLTNLLRLGLDCNKLTFVPREIASLTQLEWLGLDGNELTLLPPNIGCLAQLKTLSLNRNKLTSLPSKMGQLEQLQKLGLVENQLASLPTEMGLLKHLKRLGLQNNELESLPTEIGQLKSLKNFNISNNKLALLPTEIGTLTHLESLWLDENELQSLPSEVGHLTMLKCIWLNHNRLTVLPSEVGNLPELKWCFAEGNPLSFSQSVAYNLLSPQLASYF